MQEFSSISVSSYEAGSLADRLNERASDGWDVVAIVPTGSTVTAYLSRSAGSEDTADAATDTGSEPEDSMAGAAVAGAAAAAAVGAADTEPEPAEPEPVAAEPEPVAAEPEPAEQETPTISWPSDDAASAATEPATEPQHDGQSGDIAALAAAIGSESPETGDAAGSEWSASAAQDDGSPTLPDTAAGAAATGAVAAEPEPEPPAAEPPAAEPPAAEPPAAEPASGQVAPAGWYADPSGRFELRYWDGSQWTEHVSRSGQQYTDPPVA
jgi:hypothetical protein